MTDKLVAGAAAYRKKNGKTEWLIVKEEENGNWILPKGDVRRGESSVRAVLRSLSEDLGMRSKVLEEAGRATVSTTISGEPTVQKLIFYLLQRRPGGEEANGYAEENWLPYSQAKRSLGFAREKRILRQANDALKVWRKEKRGV